MAFRLDPLKSPGPELLRLVEEQIEKVRSVVERDDRAGPDAIRGLRVRCKRVRAVLRLGRAGMGEKAFKRQNRWWRDASRILSGARDRSAKIEALNAIREDVDAVCSESVVARLQAWFELDRVSLGDGALEANAMAAFCEHFEGWQEKSVHGLADCRGGQVRDGYDRAFRSARRGLTLALDGDEPELFHEWRKQIKTMGLQARMLRETYPQLERHIEVTRETARLLGRAQDIEVVLDSLLGDPALPVNASEKEALQQLLHDRRDVMFHAAAGIAQALFEDAPTALKAAG